MADEKRIATFEWLAQNIGGCKKGTPPETLECVRKDEIIANYDVDTTLLSAYTNNQDIPREICVCNTKEIVGCSESITANGNNGIYEISFQLGEEAGLVKIDVSSFSVPDRFIVYGPANEVLADSLYFGRYQPSIMTKALDIFKYNSALKKFEPTNTQETISITHSDIDINSADNKTLTFNKPFTQGGYIIKMRVIGPEGGTVWNLRMNCPDPNPQILKGFDGPVRAIAIQDDDKIVIGGQFNSYGGKSFSKIVRLLPNGDIDNSFNVFKDKFGYNTDYVNTIAIQRDGKIVVGGSFSSYNNNQTKNILRLNADGTFDNTFNTGAGFEPYEVRDIKILPNGKIAVNGAFNRFNNYSNGMSLGGTNGMGLAVLNTNGSRDTAFDKNIVLYEPYAYRMFVDNYGMLFINGVSQKEGSSTIVRINSICRILNENYKFDDEYRNFSYVDKISRVKYIRGIDIFDANHILIAGVFRNVGAEEGYRTISLRNYMTGKYVPSEFDNYITDTNEENTVTDLCTNISEGLIIMTGKFNTIGGVSASNICKFNLNKTIDSSFSNAIGFNDTTNCVKIQKNGKILVGGNFTKDKNGQEMPYLVRLNKNGSIDNKFMI